MFVNIISYVLVEAKSGFVIHSNAESIVFGIWSLFLSWKLMNISSLIDPFPSLTWLLTDAPFLMPVTISLLREHLCAEGTWKRLELVVRANVILYVWQLVEGLGADLALHTLVLAASSFILHKHCAPQLFLANGFWLSLVNLSSLSYRIRWFFSGREMSRLNDSLRSSLNFSQRLQENKMRPKVKWPRCHGWSHGRVRLAVGTLVAGQAWGARWPKVVASRLLRLDFLNKRRSLIGLHLRWLALLRL